MKPDRQAGLAGASCTAFPGLITGVLWLGLLAQPSAAQPSGGLFTPRASFNSTNHLVSVSVFQWFSANGGQLSGPWRPMEGRSNWTGTTDFWRSQLKQMMAANIDVLYVHLIPSSEQERINLFQALNQLRGEGWNVPKVAPFLDPIITWNQQPLLDVATTVGKDEFVGQYIRFFNQYYSVNQDANADDYLARIDGRVVLDTWHVKFNLANLNSLSRANVEGRLQAVFAHNHPVFTNGIRMVTTALNEPTLSFADEKVPQFETTTYYYPFAWNQVGSVQLKGGYWDQNIRNPGDFLARKGGVPYSNVWNQVVRARGTIRRAYLESWNEYDEGSGMYAANPGQPFVRPGSGNTNTDIWSNGNDPYEYIKTTARGAAQFNDWPLRDAKIVWHNIPTRMLPGETRVATVVVRNEGDASWTAAASYRFGQKEFEDLVVFGAGRYVLDDTKDDIPTYGGIFRGRVKTFQVSVKAPKTPGTYSTHWGMLQEHVEWFGQEISQKILVDPTPIIHGSPQTVDSTGTYTNRIDDFTEHTYSAAAGEIGSFAECPITRKFAAPIRSIKVTIVSGTADDIGYIGGTLVTPNSLGTPHCSTLGFVNSPVDVSSQVALRANEATLNLRAQENCCCVTGWGEDTASGRGNAKLHWQVELWPPVPIGPTLSNSANGHFYVLLSPATWTWSERAAVDLGGHLVSISNRAEQDWVYNSFSTFAGTNRVLWIGFNDVASEGRFVWSSGEPVTFTYWAPGEPNNAVGGEDFTAVYEPGHPAAAHWNDFGERVMSDNLPIDGVVELVPPMGPPRIATQPSGSLVNQGATVKLSVAASGSPSLQYQWRRNGVNISGATTSLYSLSNVQFGSSGTYSVIVTNPLGSVTSSDAVLIVNRPPVARCSAKTVTAGADCRAPVSIDAGSADPDGDPLTILQSPPGPYPLGDTLVNLIVTDPYGLSNSCRAFVTVLDRTPPTLVCPDNLIRTNDLDQCGALVVYPIATASDLCSAVGIVTCLPASGSLFPLGATTVQCMAKDESDNTGVCSFTVTVRDVQPPGITCAPDIVVTNAHDSWTSIVSFQPTATDNCPGIGTPSCSPASGSAFGLGTNQVTCTVSDASGNLSQCSFTVTVYPGNQPPVPEIEVSPLAHLPGYTNLIVITPDGFAARVQLDGSKSHDPDDLSFAFSWSEGTNLFSTNVVAERILGLGAHEIRLWLDDGFPLGTNTASIVVEVIAPGDAVGAVIDLLENSNLGRKNVQPLEASLNAAEASFERGNVTAAINQLSAFQNKVRAQIAPFNAQLANELIQAAQAIIDAARAA